MHSKMTVDIHEFTIHFFFYKNIVFSAQAEYSYFSANVRLKILFWIFLDNSIWHFHFRMSWGIQVFGVRICIELSLASNIWLVPVFIVLFASFAVWRKEEFYGLVKNIQLYCIFKFSTLKIIFFSKSQPQVYS